MKDADVIVVGAGLFGQVVTRHLTSLGMKTIMLDANYKNAGSGPAACLMKPSWFSGLGEAVYKPSLELLDRHYGVHDIEFKIRPSGLRATVHWCNPAQILEPVPHHAEVTGVWPSMVLDSKGKIRRAKLAVVVAAGVWSDRLVPIPGLVGKAGSAFLWPSMRLSQPTISTWAPYRQLVGFNRGDGAWVGDGTALKPEHWTERRQLESYVRCAKVLDRQGCGDLDAGRALPLYGIRPYMPKAKPCHLKQISPGLIVATGGAKNGTLAAGWAAHKIGEMLS